MVYRRLPKYNVVATLQVACPKYTYKYFHHWYIHHVYIFIPHCQLSFAFKWSIRRQVLLCCSELKIVQCAGNRRTEMSKARTVKGVGWDVSAIGNGTHHTLE